jgi:hypothetical protein
MEKIPTIQILSRNNYEGQRLIRLPNVFPLPALAASSIRVQTSIISLTANNLTYGRIGHLLSIWDIHPLPLSIPKEYSDPKEFGRIAAWGYATVLLSNIPEIEIGAQIFGQLPIGTLPLDMHVRVNPEMPTQFVEISKHRENVMSLYNQYAVYPPVPRSQEPKQSQGYDALFQIFFTTSYLINRFIFPWNENEFILPGTAKDNWTLKKGTLDEKTVVLVFADSGKTSLALAYLLRNARPTGKKPGVVVGIGSSSSRDFAKGTGLYDKVLTYDSDSTADLVDQLDLTKDSKVVLCEFGSRSGAADRWEEKLRQRHGNVVQLIVAGEVVVETPEKATERFAARTARGATVFNASVARAKAVDVVGEKRYNRELLEEWTIFKERGLINGLNMVWGNGMDDVGQGWEKLCRGEVKANEGLVFSLE